jgi:hypothetical protein
MHNSTQFSGLLVSAILALAVGCAAADADAIGDESVASQDLTGTVSVGASLVTTARVNFREEPNTNSSVIRVLAKGAVLKVLNASPDGAFYNVENGGDEGWVHGGYLAKAGSGGGTGGGTGGGSGTCTERRLTFSADSLPSVPAAGAAFVWGGNATGGEGTARYSSAFLARAQLAHTRGMPVFAYLEGPCGDTGGVDDGERLRCENLHNAFNRQNAPGTPNTAKARWKPYTMKQLTESGANGVDYCEIDNLENAVTIPLNPLAREIKALYDAGKIHCRLVLKNVDESGLDSLRAEVAPTPAAANFIAPFHIFEANNTSEKASLDAAMVRLKGAGAKTIISTDTNHYGSAFTNDRFRACD